MKPHFSLRLRVFNLNCWAWEEPAAPRLTAGPSSSDVRRVKNPSSHLLVPSVPRGIPYLSKHRADRMKRLGDFLNVESFDLALLEEVWSEQDFQYLRQKLLPTYPAAHYFRSGIIGSGLCVFSKHPIQEFTQHVYTLNGYPYMLHAEYNRQKDIYLAHRVAQAWELAHFIHHTSKKADMVLLCGDLNLHPKDLGFRLLKEWTGLHDAYLETQDFKGSEEGCTMVPENCYVNQQELEPFPCGIRIDYVLYKAVSGFCISCKTLKTTTGHDPHSGTPLSDHEALMATLCVRHSPPQHNPSPTHGPVERSPLISVLREACTELDLGVAQARWWATFASYVIGLGLLFLAVLSALVAEGGIREIAILLWTLSVGLVLGVGAVYLFHLQEAKGLCRARAELQHVLGRAREAQNLGPEFKPALFLEHQEGYRTEDQ
ncbi:sphingomyelin phosphodiesterase 2 isoform X1 [Pteropus vampyrus]|uniref:sphingomyelin phosphodiesterase n=1 Tax=Pteropus vampyrus TaxID=132908 RepID=A0A6P6CP78_PTEVA|nr:sphingomyelin phosphodiesterase 2 isoform X1 [Pteropus vampyrus]